MREKGWSVAPPASPSDTLARPGILGDVVESDGPEPVADAAGLAG